MTSTTGTEKRYANASGTGVANPQPLLGADGFVTSEWEAAADWDVPAEWPPGSGRVDGEHHGSFFATGPQPIPDWLAELAVAPAQPRQPQPPLPRRRDVRRGTAELPVVPPVVPTAPAAYAAPPTGLLHEVVRPREATAPLETLPIPPAGPRGRDDGTRAAPGQPTELPRRRDVHRPDRSAARRATVLAYTGGEPPSRTTVRAGGLPVAAARIGVVSVLVAVGAGVIGGEHFGIVGDGAESLTAAESATALSLAPLPSDPRQLTIWDRGRDQLGLEKAAKKVAAARAAEAAAKERQRIAAEKKKKAEEAARLKAVRALEAATRNAQRDPRAIAKILVAKRGWSSSQFQCLDALWQRESGWNYQAQNRSSGAYGIPQALPGSKMGTVASDWRTNPITQITWGLNYIAARYGTPCGAWSHSQNVGWY